MGGSKSKPKRPNPQQQQASSGSDAMIGMMMMQQQQQANQAAEQARLVEEARQQAMLEQQRQSGFAAAQQGEAMARQKLGQYGIQQQIADQAGLASAQQAQSALGSRSVGGMAGAPSQAQKIAGLGMGAGSSYAPSGGIGGVAQAAANIGAGGMGQAQNMFKLPSSSNIKFGGS